MYSLDFKKSSARFDTLQIPRQTVTGIKIYVALPIRSRLRIGARRPATSVSHTQRPGDGLGIEHTAAPGAAADFLQSGPKPCLLRQRRIGRKAGGERAGGQDARSRFGAAAANQVDRTFQVDPVDRD